MTRNPPKRIPARNLAPKPEPEAPPPPAPEPAPDLEDESEEVEPSPGPWFVAGQTAYLTVPARATLRLAVLSTLTSVGRDSHAYTLLAAAALLLCWPTGQNKLRIPYNNRVLDYGDAVMERLIEEGAKFGQAPQETQNEILEAGDAAIHLILRSLPDRKHLRAAEGNSGGSTGPGSANSSK